MVLVGSLSKEVGACSCFEDRKELEESLRTSLSLRSLQKHLFGKRVSLEVGRMD